MKQQRSVMVFHAPTDLYEQAKVIASDEQITLSTMCRESLRLVVNDYRKNNPLSDESSKPVII